jgi:transposase
MARERLDVRQIRDVIRLHFLGVGRNKIAGSLGIGRNTVSDYLGRAGVTGVTSYESVAGLDDVELERRLGFWRGHSQAEKRDNEKPLPDFREVHEELRRDGVTLYLLWQEYLTENSHGYRYTQFAEHYRRWRRKLSLVMRQTHRAGDKSFVDYCDGLFITNAVTGEKFKTQLFVGVLGASSYTFAEATMSQSLPDWLMSHVRMFEFFGGVTTSVVPDNLKSGVSKACFYDPKINPSYQDLAEHYDTAILPAKVRKPRYKAKAEVAVLVVQRWILAVLRNRTFYSLNELNLAIRELLQKLNDRKMRHLGKSRTELFETLDRPALQPLPATRYEFGEWKAARVNIDYHIEFDHNYYSVHYTLVQEEVRVRATAQTVEIFFKGKRVASHVRCYLRGKYMTDPSHRPPNHKFVAEWTPERVISWGSKIGLEVGLLVEAIVNNKKSPEQGFRSALGVIRLCKQYGEQRLRQASAKAIAIKSPAYQTVKTMLQTGMDLVPLEKTSKKLLGESQMTLFHGENLRGKGYYH